MLVSVDGQIRDPGLLALLDLEPDEQIALVALVIVDELALHLDFMETVCIVQSANRSHIILQERRSNTVRERHTRRAESSSRPVKKTPS